MAIYKLFPSKDATLYTQNITMNTGLDEILEASTYLLDGRSQVSRYLIKFSQNEIDGSYDTYISSSDVNYLQGNIFSSIIDNPTSLSSSVGGADKYYPVTSSKKVLIPPIPEPQITPAFVKSSDSRSRFESSIACLLATKAYCAYKSNFRASLRSK